MHFSLCDLFNPTDNRLTALNQKINEVMFYYSSISFDILSKNLTDLACFLFLSNIMSVTGLISDHKLHCNQDERGAVSLACAHSST